MTTCNHCGSTAVVMRETKAGFPMLMEASVQHRFVCRAQKSGKPKAKGSRNGAPKAPKKPGVDPETRAMVVKNWGKAQAEELLPYAKGETLEDQFLSVLHYINNKEGS